MGKGLGSPSSDKETSLSLGARKRNVTRLSEWTSGEISCGGGVCARPATAVSKNASKSSSSKRKNVRVTYSPPGREGLLKLRMALPHLCWRLKAPSVPV